MLVLTRKVGESLLIGDNIEIKITEISGDKIKIGIEAPMEMKILRKELYQSIIQENREAAKGPEQGELSSLKELFGSLD